MAKTVLITLDDQGQYSVGLQTEAIPSPEGMQPETPGGDMQPAPDLMQALKMAKDLLAGESQDLGPNSPFEQGQAKVMGMRNNTVQDGMMGKGMMA